MTKIIFIVLIFATIMNAQITNSLFKRLQNSFNPKDSAVVVITIYKFEEDYANGIANKIMRWNKETYLWDKVNPSKSYTPSSSVGPIKDLKMEIDDRFIHIHFGWTDKESGKTYIYDEYFPTSRISKISFENNKACRITLYSPQG